MHLPYKTILHEMVEKKDSTITTIPTFTYPQVKSIPYAVPEKGGYTTLQNCTTFYPLPIWNGNKNRSIKKISSISLCCRFLPIRGYMHVCGGPVCGHNNENSKVK